MKPFTTTALFFWLQPVARPVVRLLVWGDAGHHTGYTQIVTALLVYLGACEGIPYVMDSLMDLFQSGLTDGWAVSFLTGRLCIALWAAWYCLKTVFSLVGGTNSPGEFTAAAPVSCLLVGLLVVGSGVRDWFLTDPHPGLLAVSLLMIGWLVSCVWPTLTTRAS